jgi:predicted DNA-binding protein YlxM (UPF0122 family)
MSAPPTGAVPRGGSSASGVLSNATIHIQKKIAESKARTLGRKMLAEYCINMNKQMVKNVSRIVEGLDINNQTEIFQEVADQFFDKDLSDTFIDELKNVTRVSVKKNLRRILYDHFKEDLKIEKEEEKKKEEAEEQQTGGAEDAAGAGPGLEEAKKSEEDEEVDKAVEAEEEAVDAEEEDDEVEVEASEGDSSGTGGDDAAGMSLDILNTINDQLLTDDEFLKEVKTGIISNVTSGSFKSAMQREVFAQLVPKLKTMIEEKITGILDTDELKDAAIEVTKGQQKLYNVQNKQGGKKHSIKKTAKTHGKKTRKQRK